MEKEIKIKIEKSEIKETSVFGGIQGEGGARTLKISFDSEWSGLTKKITFFDGAMQNPVIIALTEDKKENGEYSVKIPSEPLKTGGKFTFIIDGTADGIRQRSVQRELRVKYAYPSKGTEETETITPTVAEQLTASVNSNIEKTMELSAEVENNKTEIGTLKGRATAAEAAIALKADKTELPKKVSELENDSGYLTEHQSLEAYAKKTEVSLKADKTELPKKVSELENDSGYLTEHQSLEDYAKKTEVSLKADKTELPKKLTDLDVEWKKVSLDYDTDKTVLNTLGDGFYRISEATNCGYGSIPSMSDIKHEVYYLVVLTQKEDFRGYDEIDSAVEGTTPDGATIIGGVSVHTQHIQYMIKNNSVNMRIFDYKYNLVNGWKKINTTETELASYVEGKLKSYPKNTEVLTKTNTTTYVPAEDYHPSTKKYTDDAVTKLKKQSIPQGKAEGYPAKITDGLAGESPLKLNVYGNSGKNMLKATDFYSALQKLAKGGDNILYEELEEDGRKCVRFIDNFTARYQILPFKENTQYTISMDCRTKIKTNENTIGSTLFVFFYTDGTSSDAVPLERNTPWTHKTATSKANKTISAIGIRSRTFSNWCYVDVDTFQLEEGAAATDYEAFDGVGDLNSASGKYEISVSAADYEKSISGGTLTATLDRQLSPGEYIDLIGKKLVSAVGETDITVSGELEIPETETCYISAGTEMSPEKIEAGYYQDINKVIKEMKNSILSLGGNV